MARTCVALVAVICLLLLALQPSGASASKRFERGKTTTVLAAGGSSPFTWTWDPAEITVAKGDRVTWENPTDADHHVTFWDGPLDSTEHVHVGDSLTLKFKKPGVYKYWCDIFGHADIVHAAEERICVGMCGVITVE